MDSKTLALIATLVLAATVTMNTSSSNSSWEDFKQTHGKVYESEEEEAYRMAVFMQAESEVATHNTNSIQTHTIGINQFSDLTNEEFSSIYLGYKPEQENYTVEENTNMVGEVNWVTKGGVQKVKNQGTCGSCWAFSAVASTESAKFVSTGTLGDFSENQLKDCSYKYGNLGCFGGLMDNAFKFYKDHYVCTEESYPYHALPGLCHQKKCTQDSFKVTGHTDVAKSTDALQTAVQDRPISIGVAAQNWQSYKGGIFSDCSTKMDHGVLLAGYTSEYWLVKNSWGPTWGEKGYIRLAPGNTCGLANTASYPTGK